MTLFIGETIERMGKREEWSVPHEILIARFLTVVRACDREFANGTRLSTAPSFPPLEERGGDRSRKVTPPQFVSLSLSPSRISPCASRVGRWQCTGGLAPDTPYAVTLSQPRGILLCTSACNSRTIVPSLFSPLLFSRLRFAHWYSNIFQRDHPISYPMHRPFFSPSKDDRSVAVSVFFSKIARNTAPFPSVSSTIARPWVEKLTKSWAIVR